MSKAEQQIFSRFISIDWSGAETDEDRVAVRVAQSIDGHAGMIVPPPPPGIVNWTRLEAFGFLASEVLRPNDPRALVALDFGFGLPWGSGQALFGVAGWHELVESIARVYQECGNARAAAEEINDFPQFHGHGPFRLYGGDRDFHFYSDNQVSYFRLVECAVPQAISQWYLGPGPTVGYSTISGLNVMAQLLALRDGGKLDFHVWPQEVLSPSGDGHVIVESYPAVAPEPNNKGQHFHDEHQRDALRVLQVMLDHHDAGTLGALFALPVLPFGRIDGVAFNAQVQFEGWILGVS